MSPNSWGNLPCRARVMLLHGREELKAKRKKVPKRKIGALNLCGDGRWPEENGEDAQTVPQKIGLREWSLQHHL